VSTSFSSVREPDFLKESSRSEPASLVQPFPELSAPPPMSASASCNESPMRLVSPLLDSSTQRSTNASMTSTTPNSPGASLMDPRISSRRTRFLPQSMRPPDDRVNDTVAPADRQWIVKFHREPQKRVTEFGGEESDKFRPTIGSIIGALKSNPKQFPKKHGQLKDIRAAGTTFADGVTWKVVFVLDEGSRSVTVLALAPHDIAYAEAKRRI
jgi:hypothetical protein